MSPQKWREIYLIDLQILHIFCVTSGSVRVKTRNYETTKLRNATAGELLNSIIHYHFGQTLNGESLKKIGRPPSFTSAWFSQTVILKFVAKSDNRETHNIATKYFLSCQFYKALIVMFTSLPSPKLVALQVICWDRLTGSTSKLIWRGILD